MIFDMAIGAVASAIVAYLLHSHYASAIKAEIQKIEKEAEGGIVADVRSVIARIKAVI